MNFFQLASFSFDEACLKAFTGGAANEKIIVFTCERVCGFLIDEMSMIPRLGGAPECEVLVPCPSFFRVSGTARLFRNVLTVPLEFDGAVSARRGYVRHKALNELFSTGRLVHFMPRSLVQRCVYNGTLCGA